MRKNDKSFEILYRLRKINTVNWLQKGCTESLCSGLLKFRPSFWLHSVHICVSTSGHYWERYVHHWALNVMASLALINKCCDNVVTHEKSRNNNRFIIII